MCYFIWNPSLFNRKCYKFLDYVPGFAQIYSSTAALFTTLASIALKTLSLTVN